MKITDPPKNLISVADAAQQLGISRRSVFRMLSRGALPAVRLGRLTRIRAADLNHMIDTLPARNGGAR